MEFETNVGPYIKSDNSTQKMMIRLLISLSIIVCFVVFKNIIMGYYYSTESFVSLLNPIYMILTGVVVSYLSEYLYNAIILKTGFKRAFTNTNKSYPTITGLLLSLLLPVNTPIWIVALGAFVANVFGKMIFGGFGKNIFNPALIGYMFVALLFSSKLGGYLNAYELDAVGGVTPLANLVNNGYISSYNVLVGSYGSLFNFFVGTIPGSMGTVSKLLILIAYIYLTITKTIKWRISVAYILTAFLLTLAIGINYNLGIWYPLFNILSGGLLFGAVFNSTDPVTSPITSNGQIFYGIALGVMTILLRFLTPYTDGVVISILFMNVFVFFFDKIGIKLHDNIKKKYIPILISVIILVLSYFLIINNIKEDRKTTFDILNKINSEILTYKI